MYGCLGISDGVLYVGRYARTASVQAYDLDGHRLGVGFRFGPATDPVAESGERTDARASVDGIAVDKDRRLWVADSAGARLRAFSLFGTEFTDAPALGRSALPDEPGALGRPVDVIAVGEDVDARLVVASRGHRRHALQWIHPDGELIESLRPLGSPQERFAELTALDLRGRTLFACERRAGRVQVFRDMDFHFAIRLEPAGGVPFEPVAVAALEGGRSVIAQGGDHSALCLVDSAGRLLRVLAGTGAEEGQVAHLTDVCVEEGLDDRHGRVVVLDRDGDRVQVFNLEGRCYGSFQELVA